MNVKRNLWFRAETAHACDIHNHVMIGIYTCSWCLFHFVITPKCTIRDFLEKKQHFAVKLRILKDCNSVILKSRLLLYNSNFLLSY